MKKLMIFIMLGIFMISFASAFEFDNVKSYNENDKTVTIRNSFLSIPTDTVATIKLNTPLVNKVPMGYQKVAEFELTMSEDYSDAFKKMDFYDKRKGDKKFDRGFDYKVLSYETTTVNQYETICSNNSSCHKKKIGSYEETKEVWTKLSKSDFKNNDKLTIGLFTNVQRGDNVEWIPTFFGVEIEEWAVWTQSFEVGLKAWYKLDTLSGAVIDSSDQTNATNVGSTRGIDGIINKSFNLTRAAGDYIFADNNFGITAYPFSFSGWFNTNFSGGEMSLFGMSSRNVAPPVGINYVVNVNGADNLFVLARDDVSQDATATSTTINNGSWFNVVVVFASSTDRKLYLNGESILNQTTSVTYNDENLQFIMGAQNATIGNFYDGEIDEVGIWNRTLNQSEVRDLYNNGSGITFLDVPDVTINSPVDNFFSDVQNITFNATISDISIDTVRFFLDGSLNETNNSGVIGDYIFNKNLSEGSHTWFISANNSAGGEFNTTLRTVTVDTLFPLISVESPVGVLTINSVGLEETLNVTFTDLNLDTCWFNYNGTNITIEGCLTGVKNSTQFTLEAGNTDMTLYANDSTGRENSTFISWNYSVLINSQTFNNVTSEGSTEIFILNYSGNQTPSSVNFVYNGSITAADIDATGFPIIIVSESIIIPNVDAITNLSFFWNIIVDSLNINTSSLNQTVNPLALDNCSVFSNVLFNYTMVDESTQSFLNGSSENVSLEIDISIFSSDRSLSVINFSTNFSNTNPNSICSQTNLLNGSSFVLDSVAKYSSAARAIEYYNIRGFAINNQTNTQNITLFDVKTSEATDFQLTFKNSDFVVVENALIQVNRQYIQEGVFKTVEIPITDSNGQTVVHLIRNDVVYNFIATKDGVIIGEFNNLIAFCDDVSIGQCFIPLNALQGTVPTFNPEQDIGISSSFTFNDTTRDLVLSFSTNDGSVKTVLLSAVKMDQLGNESVCSTSVTSSSGTLTCNIPASIGNETIITSIFVDGELKLTSYFSAANDIILGDGGYFLMLFLVISLSLMFAESKSMIVGGVILGFISSGLLFFIKGGIIGGGSAVMWVIIMGIILIWKLQSEGQT